MVTYPNKEQDFPTPATLPATGKCRFSGAKAFCPASWATFKQLTKELKALRPVRMEVRRTFYDNGELHIFLSDPLNYRAPRAGGAS